MFITIINQGSFGNEEVLLDKFQSSPDHYEHRINDNHNVGDILNFPKNLPGVKRFKLVKGLRLEVVQVESIYGISEGMTRGNLGVRQVIYYCKIL